MTWESKKGMTKSQVKKAREQLRKEAVSVSELRKGDRRPWFPRVCNICMRNLTVMDPDTLQHKTTIAQFQYKTDSFITYEVCKHARHCYKELETRGELIQWDSERV